MIDSLKREWVAYYGAEYLLERNNNRIIICSVLIIAIFVITWTGGF